MCGVVGFGAKISGREEQGPEASSTTVPSASASGAELLEASQPELHKRRVVQAQTFLMTFLPE